MNELERSLVALGRELAFPPEPDLVAAVRRRLERRRRVPRRAPVLAFAALVVAVAAAFAVPPARSAILRWLGFHGVRIEFVDELPPVPPRARLALGTKTTLDAARAAVPYRLSTSVLLGPPDVVYLLRRRVWFVYGDERRPRLLVTQFPGASREPLVKKLVEPGTRIDFVTVNGAPGYWITGSPHEVLYQDEQGRILPDSVRLAGNTLLWTRGEVTLRLEGRMTKEQALRIARSLEPS
jgi:hypothetical protein